MKVGSELEASLRVDVGSGSIEGDVRCGGGVLNLTAGFAYGCGRLLGRMMFLVLKTNVEEGTHSSRFGCLTLTTRLPSS